MKEAGGKVYTMDGQILDSDFEENTTLSFIAVREDETIKESLPKYQFSNTLTSVRPGRDSNPGRRSDSPPYWTGLYEAGNIQPLYTTRAYKDGF